MSNKYNASKTAIIDASGKEWACNVPHPLPVPEGISEYESQINARGYAVLFSNPSSETWSIVRSSSTTHWIARNPLPEVPKPKTQEELDEEAFDAYHSQFSVGSCRARCLNIWKAALAFERARKTQPTNR